MPAGLNLPTNISLQTSVNAENSETKGQSELVVAEKDTSGFTSVINKIFPEINQDRQIIAGGRVCNGRKSANPRSK